MSNERLRGAGGPAGGRAFTLLEILVVVAILGILAALAGVGVSAAGKSSAKAQGLAKLREIGLAMNHYALDQAGALPGPLKQGQTPWLASSGHLINFILPYLAPEEPAGSGYKGMQESFVSKPWKNWFRSSSLGSAVSYYVNVSIPDPASNGTYYFPVGNVGSQSKNNRAVSNPNLWKANLPATRTPLMWDWTDTPGNSVPLGKLYSGINVLYLDWHVENHTELEHVAGGPWKPEGW